MVKAQKAATLIAFLAFTIPVFGDKGGGEFSKGVRAEHAANYDSAYEAYKQAYLLTPNNAKYLSAYVRLRFTAAAQHVHTGQSLRATGSLDDALKEFQRAHEIDTTNGSASQELERTADMIRRRQQRLQSKSVPRPEVMEDFGKTVELKPLSQAAITLHMTANSDSAYRTICKLAGINVIIDPDFRPQKMTLDLTDVTLEDALNLVGLQSKSFWRPVLPNTIVIAADSTTKRKELEQNVMRTFYLRNVTTPTELQDAANVVKQILDITHIQLLQGQDAMIVRGTPDQMVLAEKLLADIDKPKSEVVIDISVMQVSRDRLRQLGTNVPTSASVGIGPKGLVTAATGGSSGSGTGGSATSANTGFSFGNFSFSIPGASLTALSSDNNTKILQRPQVRALNNEKATLRIGDRVPIATGSFSPGIVGAGSVSSLISTQFTYLDVGVNIDITPHIHSDSEVTLKMSLEISSVTGSASIGGISQPTIGQRRVELDTRVTDGEVNLLGGILEDSETRSLSGYPWISKIPLLKYLFGQENKDHTENEIVFAITPHIVRSLDVTEANLQSIRVGTGSSIELRRNPAAAPPATPEHPAEPVKLKQPASPAPPSNSAGPAVLPPGNPAIKSPAAKSAPPPLATDVITQVTLQARPTIISSWPTAGAAR